MSCRLDKLFLRSRFLIRLAWVALAAWLAAGASMPASAAQTRDAAAVIREELADPQERADLARAILTFDTLVDPRIDIDAALKEIDGMVVAVRAMAGSSASAMEKLRAVRRYLYVAGGWNGNRAFRYDLADPFGTEIAHKLLPAYMKTRLGNCVSMPALFLILADRLDLPVTLSTAPNHVFVKYLGAEGKAMNLETTSGGAPARDAWIRQNFAMTDRAVANGVYLKTLTRREALAVMAEVVLENEMQAGRYRPVMNVADEILKAYPNDAPVLVAKGSAAAMLIDTQFRARYTNPLDVPADLLPAYRALVEINRSTFAEAERLGWRESDGRPTLSAVR